MFDCIKLWDSYCDRYKYCMPIDLQFPGGLAQLTAQCTSAICPTDSSEGAPMADCNPFDNNMIINAATSTQISTLDVGSVCQSAGLMVTADQSGRLGCVYDGTGRGTTSYATFKYNGERSPRTKAELLGKNQD